MGKAGGRSCLHIKTLNFLSQKVILWLAHCLRNQGLELSAVLHEMIYPNMSSQLRMHPHQAVMDTFREYFPFIRNSSGSKANPHFSFRTCSIYIIWFYYNYSIIINHKSGDICLQGVNSSLRLCELTGINTANGMGMGLSSYHYNSLFNISLTRRDEKSWPYVSANSPPWLYY